jgi:hypothetical protein
MELLILQSFTRSIFALRGAFKELSFFIEFITALTLTKQAIHMPEIRVNNSLNLEEINPINREISLRFAETSPE